MKTSTDPLVLAATNATAVPVSCGQPVSSTRLKLFLGIAMMAAAWLTYQVATDTFRLHQTMDDTFDGIATSTTVYHSKKKPVVHLSAEISETNHTAAVLLH